MFRFSLLVMSLLFSFACEADKINQHVLTPDESILGSELVQFPNDDRIYPDKSDFKLLHHIMMSNFKGERWVTITVRNTASGRRSFHKDQVLALMADGTRRFPLSFTREFKADETLSVLINFGTSQFPILRVETRNN